MLACGGMKLYCFIASVIENGDGGMQSKWSGGGSFEIFAKISSTLG